MESIDFSLTGRVALITGAARGIGLGMARALASAGCAVAIQDIDVDVAQAEAAAFEQQGLRAIALGGDIADPSLPRKLIEQVRSTLGGLHILINNAAIQSAKHWLENSSEEILTQWKANLLAPFLLCQQAAPVFQKQKWGRIINLGSIQQLKGNPNMLPYAMSKSALENFTKSLARDLAPHNVTVNLIAPGWFNTWRNREDFSTPESLERKGKQYVPNGRIGEPRDAAGLTLLLCSDAGAYLTGQSIYLDGGLSVRS